VIDAKAAITKEAFKIGAFTVRTWHILVVVAVLALATVVIVKQRSG